MSKRKSYLFRRLRISLILYLVWGITDLYPCEMGTLKTFGENSFKGTADQRTPIGVRPQVDLPIL